MERMSGAQSWGISEGRREKKLVSFWGRHSRWITGEDVPLKTTFGLCRHGHVRGRGGFGFGVTYSLGLNDSSKYPVTTATETMARGRTSRRRRHDCKIPSKAVIWPGGGNCRVGIR